jgi:uncharacterized protein YdbL (DUF1318 family)
MRKTLSAVLAIGFVVALGCSIVPKKFEAHITIDIRQHIEQQAASTLDFIEGKTDAPPSAETPPKNGKTSWLHRVGEAFSPISIAYAAELKSASPEVTRIAEELRKRNPAVQNFKSKQIVGESSRAYLEIRPSDQLNDPNERNEAQRLVAAENKDRKALYEEIAKLNKEEKVSVSTVESIYAIERLKRAKPGEIFQLPPEGSDFDAFKASSAGQKLGSECVPGAWVTIK